MFAAGVIGLVPGVLRGHDIPDERVDRGLQIVLEPARLRVRYEVSLTEWTLYQDFKRLAPELGPGTGAELIERYARLVAPLNARGLLATVDGTELAWRVEDPTVAYEEHPVLHFHFVAEVPARGDLRLRDTNYLSSYGTSRLALRAEAGVGIEGYDGPTDLDEVPEVPLWALSDEQERETREVSLAYRASGALVGHAAGQPGDATSPPPAAPAETARKPEKRGADRLIRLFWEASSGRSAPWLLLAAFVMGAAHAVQPGHGKSAVVGASIQDGGRPLGRGLVLAASASAAHLGVAVGLAVVAVTLAPARFDRIDEFLVRAVGIVLAILGAWRLGAALSGARGEAVAASRPVRSRSEAILAGATIGAIPCWDAVLLLALAWVAGTLLLGLGLVLAFSLGSALTLLGVALSAGVVRDLARRRSGSMRIERTLGAVGGLLLATIGIYLFLS